MTSVLLDHGDCVLTDTGEVIVTYAVLMRRLREGKSIDGLCTYPHPNVAEHNRRRDREKNPRGLREVTVDEIPGEFPAHLYDWKIPDEYRDSDLLRFLVERLQKKFPDTPDAYLDRLQLEYEMMLEREMEDLLRLLIYLTAMFEEHDVVHGIGRGSACASLVLFLIGVHLVDPVLYDIPISEFLR